MHLQLRHEQHVQNAETVVVPLNDHSATRWRTRNEVGMSDQERSPITQVDGKWAEWLGVVNVIELLDGHGIMLSIAHPPARTPENQPNPDQNQNR